MTNLYALRLYREILRKSRQLQLTNKDYFRRTVRKDFEKYRYLEGKENIDFQIKVWFVSRIVLACNNNYFVVYIESRIFHQQ